MLNKKLSFKLDQDNDKSWVEDDLKNLSKKDRFMGATIMENMMKEVHSTLHNIKATINGKKTSKP